jgi:hypothetical protein
VSAVQPVICANVFWLLGVDCVPLLFIPDGAKTPSFNSRMKNNTVRLLLFRCVTLCPVHDHEPMKSTYRRAPGVPPTVVMLHAT